MTRVAPSVPAPPVPTPPAEQSAEEKKKRGAPEKQEYPFADAVDATGQKLLVQVKTNDPEKPIVNKLKGIPQEIKDAQGNVAQKMYDPAQHKPISKETFVDEATYYDYRVHCLRTIGKRKLEAADKLERDAERIRKFGDTETRKKAMKINKLTEQLSQLRQQMQEEGFDLSLLED